MAISKDSSKPKGGPSTAAGKAKSSQNSLKNGLTTMNITSSEEKRMVEDYVAELMSYYQPESPLEKLQIQRIAICRAKLARLYEVEQVRLELTQKNLENNPEKIFQEMGVGKGLLRAMALEGLRREVITLPCDLSIDDLESIAYEVDHFHGALKSEKDLEDYFPHLVQFLMQYSAKGLNKDSSLLEKFEVVVRRIHKTMRNDIYFGLIGQVFEDHLQSTEKSSKTEPQDVIDLMKELDPAYVAPEPVQSHIDLRQLQSLLPLFVCLKGALKDAYDLIERFNATKSLLAQSTLLPQGEADLLMRYQTTLERRLSSSVGELLELQKRR